MYYNGPVFFSGFWNHSYSYVRGQIYGGMGAGVNWYEFIILKNGFKKDLIKSDALEKKSVIKMVYSFTVSLQWVNFILIVVCFCKNGKVHKKKLLFGFLRYSGLFILLAIELSGVRELENLSQINLKLYFCVIPFLFVLWKQLSNWKYAFKEKS